MKIGPEHVGKYVVTVGKRKARINTVHNGRFWAEYPDGDMVTFSCAADWQLVEEPKKPSERIHELCRTAPIFNTAFNPQRYLDAICAYLDELHEQGKLK